MTTTDQPQDIRTFLDAVLAKNIAKVKGFLRDQPALATAQSDGAYYEAGVTGLHLAVFAGLEMVQLLHESGASLNATSKDGSPLHQAVWIGDMEVLRYLLQQGANANATTPSGETPLHMAAYKGHVEQATILLQHGAKANVATTDGNTDMFEGSPPVVGETPLHLAAAYGHEAMVRLLLDNGASPEATDHCSQTAYHWAIRYEQHATAQILRNAMVHS